MRIIKEGKLPEEKLYTTTCQVCQTVFEFAKNEAILYTDQREGDFLKVDCPLCKKTLFIQTVSNRRW